MPIIDELDTRRELMRRLVRNCRCLSGPRGQHADKFLDAMERSAALPGSVFTDRQIVYATFLAMQGAGDRPRIFGTEDAVPIQADGGPSRAEYDAAAARWDL